MSVARKAPDRAASVTRLRQIKRELRDIWAREFARDSIRGFGGRATDESAMADIYNGLNRVIRKLRSAP